MSMQFLTTSVFQTLFLEVYIPPFVSLHMEMKRGRFEIRVQRNDVSCTDIREFVEADHNNFWTCLSETDGGHLDLVHVVEMGSVTCARKRNI